MPEMSLPCYTAEVREEWIDYNGHLSEAFYVLIFGHATDQAMEVLGMGPEYRECTGSSLYTVEAHVRYLQEVPQGVTLQVSTVIAGFAEKKLHLAHEMHLAGPGGEARSGELVATEEILGIHVGGDPAGARPFPEEVVEKIQAYGVGVEVPSWAGRAIRPLG